MIDKLKKLGLTAYEAQAYVSLLELGDAEANEIANKAKIPMGRIYSVLSSLQEARLIRSQDIRPRRYACVEPTAAIERLSKFKKEEVKQLEAEIETLANDLESELLGIRVKKISKPFWTVAIGNESSDLVRESILGAQNEILFFMASRMSSERIKKEILNEKYIEIINSLHETMEKGVEVKVILNKEVDFSTLENYPAIKEILIHMGDKLDCRLAAIPATPFDIIDSEIVALKMLNPLNPEELFAVVNIRDVKLADELRKKFFTIWENAEIYSE